MSITPRSHGFVLLEKWIGWSGFRLFNPDHRESGFLIRKSVLHLPYGISLQDRRRPGAFCNIDGS
jgi:hypothetical protein